MIYRVPISEMTRILQSSSHNSIIFKMQIVKKPELYFKNCIIGGGVVGLAIASKLSTRKSTTVVLEKGKSLGSETSSRNSEVIHGGIYYPNNSLKTALCIRGNELLYKKCTSISHKIRYRKITKWIFSNSDDESEYLNKLYQKSKKLDLALHFLPTEKIKGLEPNLKASQVLVSPETGIVDSRGLMNALEAEIRGNDGAIALDAEVVSIEKKSDYYVVRTERDEIACENVINSAGLYADTVSRMIMDTPETIHLFKGEYFGYRGNRLVNRLVYPVPERNIETLGIHATLDLNGNMRFGPDSTYLGTEKSKIEYSTDELKLDKFYNDVTRYLPNLDKSKLFSDYCGIRPKLGGPGTSFQDFIIREESGRGYPKFVNLFGIESPGLTSSLAIAEYVQNLLKN
jgi:2-hydroxyglutarate dehydrogenase